MYSRWWVLPCLITFVLNSCLFLVLIIADCCCASKHCHLKNLLIRSWLIILSIFFSISIKSVCFSFFSVINFRRWYHHLGSDIVWRNDNLLEIFLTILKQDFKPTSRCYLLWRHHSRICSYLPWKSLSKRMYKKQLTLGIN